MDTTNQPRPAVAIFCTALEIGQEPITDQYYWEAYQDLLFALKARGLEAYFAAGNATYLGQGRFSAVFTTDEKVADPTQLKPIHDVVVDMVFERAESDQFAAHDIPVINPKSVRDIANNKISIFKQYPELQPQSAVVNNPAELLAAVHDMPGGKVVVKEPDSYGGHAVYIGDKPKVLQQIPAGRYPLLVQEFLDTSGGLPGHAVGVHDVRLEICGGTITGYYIRVAKLGSLHSNFTQGGKRIFLPLETVPAELAKKVQHIDAAFGDVPRYYSADFVYSQRGWKLIELNDYVALLRNVNPGEATIDEAVVKIGGRLADYIATVARTHHDSLAKSR